MFTVPPGFPFFWQMYIRLGVRRVLLYEVPPQFLIKRWVEGKMAEITQMPHQLHSARPKAYFSGTSAEV